MRGALPFLPPTLLGVAIALAVAAERAPRDREIANAPVRAPATAAEVAPHPASNDGASRKRRTDEPDLPAGPLTVRYAITFQHLHTRELLPVALRVPVERLDTFLRCRATGHTRRMAPEPFDVAVKMGARFGASRVEVVSGYRSVKLNERLRKKGHEVASDSQHTHGTALDFALPGVPAVELARAVGAVHAGGIGTYRQSGFVHVDIGRPRRWTGR